jgi:pilus assembly protein Flp/PilA
MKFFSKLIRNEEGATAIEYGLIAALIAVAAIAAMTSLGSNLNTTFGKVNTSLTTANAVPTEAE